MLIIKPVEVDDNDILDHFIDWNPGLLKLVINYTVYNIHQVMFLYKCHKR